MFCFLVACWSTVAALFSLVLLGLRGFEGSCGDLAEILCPVAYHSDNDCLSDTSVRGLCLGIWLLKVAVW